MMGECRKTSCLPPRFPLIFNQRLVFEKTYSDAVDPSAVVDLLRADTTSFQLIQSVSPEDHHLATMKQNSKEFLNPGPSLSGAEDPMQRDALMMERSSRFHGAFPTVEFSVTSFIEESDGMDASPMRGLAGGRPSSTWARLSSSYEGRSAFRRSPSPPPCSQISCEAKKKPPKHAVCQEPGYQRPTVASATRALSPYTHRKMCQLSLDAEQRLRHLQLGPHHFRKETESLPPFLVPTRSSQMDAYSPPPQSYAHCCHTVNLSNDDLDFLLDTRYGPRASRFQLIKPMQMRSVRAWSSPGRPFRCDELSQSPHRGSAVSKRRGPVTTKHSLRERLQANDPSPSYWEQIHSRVQKILLTHRVPFDID
ncbi:spermatogenesis-associated protein 6 [Hippocampus zosterae]|uniref:spermatogenesis-associated protein 6 n=1 Tax=Hippocampus zosterae TaxID=109293 RepID=UPI00223E41DA|nr:spermatogenesis-associated protein 6 [Hippocampus zosterae]XP_051928843.1 spermatogenesis-associated protein 6 [Hippocampus zosterae]